jgi:acyl carrier protein
MLPDRLEPVAMIHRTATDRPSRLGDRCSCSEQLTFRDDTMTTTERIRAFILEELDCSVLPDELTNDTLLIDEKVIDSMAIFEVIDFLEAEFDIEILDEELLAEHFRSIAAMGQLVDSKEVDLR